MSDTEINVLVQQIQVLEPQTKDVVLRFLGLLEQAAENPQGISEKTAEDS